MTLEVRDADRGEHDVPAGFRTAVEQRRQQLGQHLRTNDGSSAIRRAAGGRSPILPWLKLDHRAVERNLDTRLT